MAMNDNTEGLNLAKCRMSEFFDEVEGKLALLTGVDGLNYEEFGLSLEEVRKPMLVIGKPGIGKTCGIMSSIKEMNKRLPKDKQLYFKKIQLGQTVVGSLDGIPVPNGNGTILRAQDPRLPDPVRDGEYGVLFLDEITTADEMQIQPALGLCDDSRNIGEYTLPEHWIVIAAGNGPDCTNFIRLDDMTLSRFYAFDIMYDYQADFRPYAHNAGIHEDIIAFLNFNPEACVRVESTDMDNAGKMFPCPRTWERLSIEMKIRAARGKPVSPDEIGNFAGRVIGTTAAREFAAFMQFRKNLKYDVNKILEGTERDPEAGMAKETYHILLQSLFKNVREEIKRYGGVDNAPVETYHRVGHMLSWLMRFYDLDSKINTIKEIRNDLPEIQEIVFDEDFCQECCPELNEFFETHAHLLQTSFDEFASMKF